MKTQRVIPTLAFLTFIISAIIPACATIPGLGEKPEPAGESAMAPAEPAEASRRTVPEGATAPLFGDLGDYHYPITTRSELAQRYFDQGLTLTYAFNHAEAVRSYREAQRLDPRCAMCFWGEAYALGPNINKPMDDADVPAAWAAAQKTLELVNGASPRERDLIQALAVRYVAEPVKDRSSLDLAYANAMRDVAKRHPDDLDVQTLFAEAVMDTMPWDYYQHGPGHEPPAPKAETEEILAVLESVLDRNPDHFGAIHYYIHAIEPSHTPERAEAPADRLRGLVPGAGHLVHMPSHIYLRVGRYADASLANEKAADADESYISQCRVQGFYPALYYPHNIHFLWASASFEGRSEVALSAAKRLVANIPEGMIAEVPIVEEFLPTYYVGLARFGKWDEILAEPEPRDDLNYLRGIWHYARGLAQAGKGELDAARAELALLEKRREAWNGSAFVFASGSTPGQLLSIARNVLAARIMGAENHWADAVPLLREAVEGQDSLPYTEPPPWYFPVREALGHALLMAEKPEEAEAVYRKQLELTPRNGWSLYGLARSLEAQGKTDVARDIERRFDKAWQLADVKLGASVF